MRVATDVITEVDTYIAAQPEPRPSRPEVIRLALKEWLAGRAIGHMPAEAQR